MQVSLGEWRNGRRAWLRTTWGNPCRFESCLAHHTNKIKTSRCFDGSVQRLSMIGNAPEIRALIHKEAENLGSFGGRLKLIRSGTHGIDGHSFFEAL